MSKAICQAALSIFTGNPIVHLDQGAPSIVTPPAASVANITVPQDEHGGGRLDVGVSGSMRKRLKTIAARVESIEALVREVHSSVCARRDHHAARESELA